MTVFVVLLTIVSVLIAYVYYALKKRRSYWHNLGIACEDPHWFFGNFQGAQTTRAFYEIYEQYYAKFKGSGPFAGFHWFIKPAVFALEPELIKQVLIKDFSNFVDRGFYNNEKDDPLTGHLFLLDGERWKNLRHKLSPTFTSGKMKYMFPTVVKVGNELIKVLSEKVAPNGSVIEVKDILARYTIDVIGTCAFGIECQSLKDPNAEFLAMGRKALVEQRHGPLVLGFMASFVEFARTLGLKQTPEVVEKFFLRIVGETVNLREQENIRRNDFMDMLIDLKNKQLLKSEHGEELSNLTLNEIAAQAFVFFAAGFETSSTTLGFALHELAQNQAVQERARQEVLKNFEKYNQEFSYDCMKDMRYLQQIISETLRLHTVLPLLSRVALEDCVVTGHPNYVIKKGMIVIIPAGAIHRDERYYPNPNTFNPDNFSTEKVAERDSVLYLAFGQGPRNCIGLRFGKMQSIIGLALLLKNFKFSVCEQTEIPLSYNKTSFLISVDKGIYLKVTKV